MCAWEAACAERDRFRGIIKRWRNQSLMRGFGAWMCAWEAACAERDRFRGIIKRWRNQSLARGWQCWSEKVADANALRSAARTIVKKWLSQSLNRGWCAWVSMVEVRHEAMRTLHHAAARMVNRRLALGFSGWLDAARGEKTHSVAEQAIRRLMRQELSKGFACWMANWERAAANLRAAQAIVRRWLNQRLTRGWDSWVEMVDEANALRNAARAVIKRWLSQSLTHALCFWIEMVAARHEAMRNLRHAAAKIVYRQLALGFSSWVHAHLTVLKGQREMRSHHLQHHAEVAQRQLEVNAINTILLAELSQADEQLYEARSRAMKWKIRACTPGAGLQDAYRSRDFHPPPPISTPSPGEVIINRLPGQSKLNPTPLRKSPATPKSAYERALFKSPLAKAGRHPEDHDFERWPETPARLRWEDQM